MIRVLFDLKKEYYFTSFYPLIKEIEKDKKYEIWIHVGKDPKRYGGLISISQRKRIVSWLESSGYRISDRTSGYDVVICGDALKNPAKYGNPLRIHIDHGVGIKTLRIRNIVKQKSVHYHLFLEGRYWFDYIKSLGWQDRASFYLTGLPKLDPLFWKNYYNDENLRARLRLNPNKKTVLFAPSYRPSCINYLREKILDLVPKYNLVIKLHPYSWGGKYAPHSHHRFYERVARKNSGVFLISNNEYDIYPYLHLADTVISDTSSVINEFLALNRIGIIYVLPDKKLKHSDGMPILSIEQEEWLKGAFVHIDTPDLVVEAVERALNPTARMKERLQYYRNYFFTGLDGKSAMRVKSEIDRLTVESSRQ